MMTKDQERAARAWSNVASVKAQTYKGEYSSWAKKFPMLVLTNGLGQALAFLRAKNKREHKALYSHLSSWVTGQIYGVEDNQLLERLIGAIANCPSDSNVYRRATTETLVFVAWLKRFAEAELEIEEGGD